jgi:hypothetical protein
MQAQILAEITSEAKPASPQTHGYPLLDAGEALGLNQVDIARPIPWLSRPTYNSGRIAPLG